MAEPFIGEIRVVSFNFAPRGWALCNGQLLPINQNQALFSILGTTYGGNGTTNFALPDLQGRVPLHFGGGIPLGQKAGLEAVALTSAQLPLHQHSLQTSADFANTSLPANAVPAARGRGGAEIYADGGAPLTPLSPAAVGTSGGSQPHDNMQPWLALTFVIALQGIFPPRN